MSITYHSPIIDRPISIISYTIINTCNTVVVKIVCAVSNSNLAILANWQTMKTSCSKFLWIVMKFILWIFYVVLSRALSRPLLSQLPPLSNFYNRPFVYLLRESHLYLEWLNWIRQEYYTAELAGPLWSDAASPTPFHSATGIANSPFLSVSRWLDSLTPSPVHLETAKVSVT